MNIAKKLALYGLTALTLTTNTQAATAKSQRRLLIVSNLTTFGMAKYEWLYKFLDASTISMGKSMLGNYYQSISALTPNLAKRQNFKNSLRAISNISSVKAIDVILSLHGANEKMWFEDGGFSTQEIKSDLLTIPHRNKFRLLYTLACYGASHRNEFLDSGFRTAVGALKTNTASASEYPEFLTRYASGHSVKNIFASTNANPALAASDAAAATMGFNDANSRKYVGGLQTLNINSNPY